MKTQRHVQRTPYNDKGRNWGYAALSQKIPKIASKQEKLRRGKERFSYRFQRDLGPTNTLISDF